MNYVIYKPNGRIVGNMSSPLWLETIGETDLQQIETESWVDPKNNRVVDGKIVEIPPAEVAAKKDLLERTEAARTFRIQRNRLLQASDWTQVPDAPVDQAAWATYRQQLRDLPENTDDPRDVVWPQKPQ